MLQPSLLILCYLYILTIASTENHPTSLIATSQTHHIHDGSYFQYSFTSMKLQQAQYNASITQYAIQLLLQFATTKPNTNLEYNILVFPQRNQTSEPLYQKYVRAAVEGLPGMMPIFPVNYSQPQISCQSCYQSALYANTPVACLKCTSSSIYTNLTSRQWADLSQWNSTVMTVIDNSLPTDGIRDGIQLTMDYGISIIYDEEFQALFILFLSVISSLIIILGFLAVFITRKIKKVQNQITVCKEKNQHQKVE